MATFYDRVVRYELIDGEYSVTLNDLLGKHLKISFTGEFNCVLCGASTNKIFGEGFCYHCFKNAPQADTCIVHPEKCRAHEGIARDLEWAKQNCLKPHYVYLAKTSKIKVGVTRQKQIPTRWIDQGADYAIKLAKTPYRQLAGQIEVEMKKYFSDKTSWQQMLKGLTTDEKLTDAKKEAIEKMPDELKKYIVFDNTVWSFKYPMLEVPVEINSVRLEKQATIEGVLTGIKGQYLIFDNKNVINIRSHSGFNIEINF